MSPSVARPLVVAAVATGLIALDAFVLRPDPDREVSRENDMSQVAPPATPAPDLASPPAAPCPDGTLPERGSCIPVPEAEAAQAPADALELAPGRPDDYARYETGVSGRAVPSSEGSSIFVQAPPGAPVEALQLDGQVGPPRYAVLPGSDARLVTVHHVSRAAAAPRRYAIVYAGVDSGAPAATWTAIPSSGPLARIASGPAPTGLRLSVRQLRASADPERITPERLLWDSHSLPCDPRNVLPLRP